MPWSKALTQKLTYCACFDSGGRRSTWRKPTQAENMQTDLNPGPSCSEPTLCHHAASDYTRRYHSGIFSSRSVHYSLTDERRCIKTILRYSWYRQLFIFPPSQTVANVVSAALLPLAAWLQCVYHWPSSPSLHHQRVLFICSVALIQLFQLIHHGDSNWGRKCPFLFWLHNGRHISFEP